MIILPSSDQIDQNHGRPRAGHHNILPSLKRGSIECNFNVWGRLAECERSNKQAKGSDKPEIKYVTLNSVLIMTI